MVGSCFIDKLIMRARFDNFTILKYDNPITVFDGGKSMCYDNHRFSFFLLVDQFINGLLDDGLIFGIKG